MNRYLFVSLILLVVFTGSAMSAGKVILVGSGAPDPKDALLIENLEKWGFTVEPHAHDETHPVNLDGITLVFISESTSSSNILGAYQDSTVPVINAESYTYDDMGFAPDGSFSSDEGDTILIVKKDHPITQGFPDEVKIQDPPAPIMGCNDLQGDVDILAVRADNEDIATISVYEAGANTMTGTTKARHINSWMHSTGWESITEDGWSLIERSVFYAVGQLTDVSQKGKLTSTWSNIKRARSTY